MSAGLAFNIASIAKFVPRATLFVNYKTNLASVLFLLKASSFKRAKSKIISANRPNPTTVVNILGEPKRGHRPMTIILSNLNRFTILSTDRFLGNFAVKCILKIPPHLAYVATLPSETLMSAKQVINDKLQGSVATHLR